jgi:hypothetical protein
MVYVILIGRKDTFVMPHPEEKDTQNIEHRNNQQRSGQHQSIETIGVYYCRIVHYVLQAQETQRVTECQTTRISHENFGTLFSFTIDVVVQERQDTSYQANGVQGIYVYA